MRFPNRNIAMIAISAGLFLVAAVPASAQLTLDQSSPTGNATMTASAGRDWQQGVTVGLDGILMGIELYATPYIGSGNNVYINSGPAWQGDARDFEVFVNEPSGWVFIDTSAAGLYFNAGDQFVIGLEGCDDGSSWNATYPGAYDGGALYRNGSVYGTYDLAFKTYIPEPASLVLLSLGAFAVVRRR